MKRITDNDQLEFKAIEDELWREYIFPSGAVLRIVGAVAINISDSRGHRIATNDGVAYYVPRDWIAIRWEGKDVQFKW